MSKNGNRTVPDIPITTPVPNFPCIDWPSAGAVIMTFGFVKSGSGSVKFYCYRDGMPIEIPGAILSSSSDRINS